MDYIFSSLQNNWTDLVPLFGSVWCGLDVTKKLQFTVGRRLFNKRGQTKKRMTISALLLCAWLDLSKMIFEDKEEEVGVVWDRVGLLSSLWASLSKHFKNVLA